MNPECPLCQSRPSMVEGPLWDGRYYCSGCGKTFHLDTEGKLIRWGLSNHTAESAFRQAVKAATKIVV